MKITLTFSAGFASGFIALFILVCLNDKSESVHAFGAGMVVGLLLFLVVLTLLEKEETT